MDDDTEFRFSIEGDQFAAADANPIDVARGAWEQVQQWVETGYRPIISVTTPDGTTVDVDLEVWDWHQS